jgi:hypothetical protein
LNGWTDLYETWRLSQFQWYTSWITSISLCVYVYPLLVVSKWLSKNTPTIARQRLCKTPIMATHAHVSFSMRSVSYQGKYEIGYSLNFLLTHMKLCKITGVNPFFTEPLMISWWHKLLSDILIYWLENMNTSFTLLWHGVANNFCLYWSV